jgi:hypothetical protein
MDSTSAEKKLSSGYRARAARDFPGLSPAITRLIHDDPSYAAWIPAQFCTSHFDRARVDDQEVGDSAANLQESQVLSTWLIGASRDNRQCQCRPQLLHRGTAEQQLAAAPSGRDVGPARGSPGSHRGQGPGEH